jgi:hypothetical protein
MILHQSFSLFKNKFKYKKDLKSRLHPNQSTLINPAYLANPHSHKVEKYQMLMI